MLIHDQNMIFKKILCTHKTQGLRLACLNDQQEHPGTSLERTAVHSAQPMDGEAEHMKS